MLVHDAERILGVSAGASEHEIKQAYKRCSLRAHHQAKQVGAHGVLLAFGRRRASRVCEQQELSSARESNGKSWRQHTI